MVNNPRPRKNWKRVFNPEPQPTPQDEMWYSPIPLDVMWGIYARQSTLGQLLNHTESTEMQTDDLKAWLVQKGVKDGQWKLFDADLGVSGTLPIEQRTGLQELVEYIKSGLIKAVLVYQISRLFRDDTGVEYNTFAKICKEHDCVLVTADGMVFNFNNRMHLKMFRFLAEYAAEFIPQQIGLLQAARIRKAKRGFYVGLGNIARGYIVDYDKDSPTYKRLIPYEPYIQPVLNLFERFYALEANLAQLCREVEEMPYVFPDYELWVDRRNIRDKRFKKVPGGYHVTRRGLLSILTNPVYIGWLILNGDIISMNNHEAIIPPEKRYLFWYAFDALSEFTTKGEKNDKRTISPRRTFYQKKRTHYEFGLLKGKIETPRGTPIYVHVSEGVHSYCTPKQGIVMASRQESEIETALIDTEFTKRLFLHLRQTHDFDMFRQWVTEVIQKQTTQLEIIQKQLEEVEIQQETILDERLAIRAHINQQIKDALASDKTANSEELRERFEQEAAQDIERLRKRTARLDEREKELRAKLPNEEDDQQVKTARTFADFQTELARLAEEWDEKPIKEKREFVSLLVEKTILSVMSTHWVEFIIHWKHPAWPNETLYIRRKFGKFHTWTEEENEFLRKFYRNGDKAMLLSSMPHRTWSGIRNQCNNLGVKRVYRREYVGIDENTSWSDYQFFQALQVNPSSRETICLVDEGTNSDPSSSL
jgi:hypothetical protein